MSGEREHGGLCTTCENDATCAFPRKAGQPVLQCEEFTIHRAPAAPGSHKKPPDAGPSPRPQLGMGLCCNCDNQEDCTFPSARQGVVHCEEHR
jgi:hypothetical protein